MTDADHQALEAGREASPANALLRVQKNGDWPKVAGLITSPMLT